MKGLAAGVFTAMIVVYIAQARSSSESGSQSMLEAQEPDAEGIRIARGVGDSEIDQTEAEEMSNPEWFRSAQASAQAQADDLHLQLNPEDSPVLQRGPAVDDLRAQEVQSSTDTPTLDSMNEVDHLDVQLEQEARASRQREHDALRMAQLSATAAEANDTAPSTSEAAAAPANETTVEEPASETAVEEPASETVEVNVQAEPVVKPRVGFEGTWIAILGSPSQPQCEEAIKVLKKTESGVFSGPDIPTSCFNSYYADWLEAAGARVIGVPFDASDELLDVVLSGVSGVVWPGGDVYLESNTTLYQTARKMLDKIINENRKGRVLPLLGICQGYELMASLVAGTTTILERDAYLADGVSLAVHFTPEASQSKFLAVIGKDTVAMLASNKIATHIHADGILPESFMANRNLRALFRIVATTWDLQHKPMISIMEGKTMPLVGLQWHPERPQFDWRPDLGVAHTPEAIASMTAIADGFVNIARLSRRTMNLPEHERLVKQASAFALHRVAIGPLEDGIASLMFDPPVPLGMDAQSSKKSDHAWRIPQQDVSHHRRDVKLSMEDADPPGEGVNATTKEPLGNTTESSPLPAEDSSTNESAQQEAATEALNAQGQVGEELPAEEPVVSDEPPTDVEPIEQPPVDSVPQFRQIPLARSKLRRPVEASLHRAHER